MINSIVRKGLLPVLAVGFLLLGQSAVAAEMKCKECHEGQVTSFQGSHHAKSWGDSHSCEACHGATDAHIKAGGGKDTIISFAKKSAQSAEAQSKQCLTCHATMKALQFWTMGKHKQNGVSCASCHQTHGGKMAEKPKAETCLACHKDIKSQLNKSSHHPVIEGKVSCADCHNPHGSPTHGMLKADNVNQLCYKCHADKRGPFLWEHSPVEENCLACHTPHGSQHAKLLTARAPQLCENCHSGAHGAGANPDGNQAFGKPTRFKQVFGRACLNCHNHIHGSMAPHDAQNNGEYTSGKYLVR